MGGGGGPVPGQRTVTLTLQVNLEDLTDENQDEIRDQITDLVTSLGGSDIEFDPFEAGSTIITLNSATSFSVVQLKDTITSLNENETIKYTVENIERSTFFTKIEKEVIEYPNDIVIVKTDNTKVYGSVEDDGIVTREIINELIGDTEENRNTIQCVLFGGKSTSIADGTNDADLVFASCNNLNTINFGNIDRVGSFAFSVCNSLTNIDFNIVSNLGTRSFAGCINLVKIDLKNMTKTGDDSFLGCSELANIDFGKLNEISSTTFRDCNSIQSIDFKNVKIVGESAFQECQNLSTIDFKNVETIGSGAFFGCNAIISLDLKNVNQVGVSAFSSCINLETINLGSVNKIEQATFILCGNLKSIRINRELTTSVGTNAFRICPVAAQDNEANPFLLGNDINDISFLTDNELFSSKSIGDNPGDLMLVDYPPDTNYKRLTVRP